MNKQVDSVKRRMTTNVKMWVLLVAVLAALIVGGLSHSIFPKGDGQQTADQATGRQVWTCSMHPQIQLPQPGKCPLCGMNLILMELQETEQTSLRDLTVSNAARKLMAIRTSPVERRFVEAEIRMVGKIDYDETLLKYITAWVPGRLDRLYVDYTGVSVIKGDHLVDLYSPELLSAQEELLQALAAVENLRGSDIGIVRQMTEDTVTAAREKLRLWGLKPEQITELERRGQASDHVTIFAPIGGVVIHKMAQEGMYVQTGTRIYTIADLSQVWVQMDAYESDLQWLRLGQKVELTTEAHPGEYFIGTIAFINPVLNDKTRTVKIRVNVANPEMSLKPGMFVRAIVHAKVALGGRVMDEYLAGKWMCRMHPEIVREVAGDCDVCGMALVRTESLGYVGVDVDNTDAPLIIPVTAALITGGRSAGSRAIVYVQIDPSLLTLSGVLDWSDLLRTISVHRAGPMARLWALLSADLQDDLQAADPQYVPPAELKHRFVNQINEVLASQALFHADDWQTTPLPSEAAGLISSSSTALTGTSLTRLNRLLLEALFPNALMGARNGPTFQGREILLGPRAGKYFIVRRGLAEGERVVTHGNFKIDAELQIRAQPAMMTPEGGGAGGHDHGGGGDKGDGKKMTDMDMAVKMPAVAKAELRAVLAAADQAVQAAEAGDLFEARQAFNALAEKVQAVRQDQFTGEALLLWREYEMLLGNDGVEGEMVEDIQQAKNVAGFTSEHIVSMRTKMGLPLVKSVAVVDPEFRRQFDDVLAGYMLLREALANDDLPAAASAAEQTLQAAEAVDMALLTGPTHTTWMETVGLLTQVLTDITATDDIQQAREGLSQLSEQVIAAIGQFGGSPAGPIYQFRCPMAFDSSIPANWLQRDDATHNPYLGAAMPGCGNVTEIIPAWQAEGDSDE